jgi:hypothetical protein
MMRADSGGAAAGTGTAGAAAEARRDRADRADRRSGVRRGGGAAALAAVWLATRALLLLTVLKVLPFPGPDVTVDVSVIYRGWYEVLSGGSFPVGDVTWQYPPGAALAVLSPALLPFWEYATAFHALVALCDAGVVALLWRAGHRPGAGPRGAWLWTCGVPLLGPTAYARYDLMVTAVAVAGLVAGARRPGVLGALAGFGALLKVWPVLLLTGVRRGRPWRRALAAAVLTGSGLLALFLLLMPGSLAFLGHQRDRGTEVESLGALVFHAARWAGWEGRVVLNYGSVEFLGPYVPVVSALALVLSLAAAGWLVVWRLRVREFGPGTAAEAAFTAVLLFTVTSRVISPQYLLWPLGLAAVCLVRRDTRMVRPALLVAVAAAVTVLEFPVWFGHVVGSTPLGLLLLVVRNGLLVAAAVMACARLRRPAAPAGTAAAPAPGSAGPREPAGAGVRT